VSPTAGTPTFVLIASILSVSALRSFAYPNKVSPVVSNVPILAVSVLIAVTSAPSVVPVIASTVDFI
jgi:hypothetical protein